MCERGFASPSVTAPAGGDPPPTPRSPPEAGAEGRTKNMGSRKVFYSLCVLWPVTYLSELLSSWEIGAYANVQGVGEAW